MTEKAKEIFRRVNQELNRQESDTSQNRIIVHRENEQHRVFRIERSEDPEHEPEPAVAE